MSLLSHAELELDRIGMTEDSHVDVTFPYTPPDKPVYEYRWSEASPRSLPQNEQGFI
jgi:hypothetical protein